MEESIVPLTIVDHEQGHAENINDLQNFMNEKVGPSERRRGCEIDDW